MVNDWKRHAVMFSLIGAAAMAPIKLEGQTPVASTTMSSTAGKTIPVNRDYFPSVRLDENPQSSDLIKKRYSEALLALDERPLVTEHPGTAANESYRFLWLRTFNHPVAIRLDMNVDGTSLLTTKVSNGQGGYDPGKLIVNRKRHLTKQETSWFLEGVKEVGFWNLSTYEKPGEQTGPDGEKTVMVHLDGAQWIFEAIKDRQYHVVDRWSPENGPIHILGTMMLIDLAHLKLLYQDVY
jgi:hypothetical protein